ncbi:MAG: efflux RND transporter periplasmic adaptor subunit [Bryobacteraceae bacterium]
MASDLDSLRIDPSMKTGGGGSRWATGWILGGVLLFLLLGAGSFVYSKMNAAIEVKTARAVATASGAGPAGSVILNATGYIVAHHKIQLASKVMGKVAWIGVEKGDAVKQGQVIVRLEDDEYRAQVQQAKGQVTALEARLAELANGSRPEEVSLAKANVDQAKADLENARTTLARAQKMVADGLVSKQAVDDGVAREAGQAARVASLERAYELVKIGPRREVMDQVRGQIAEAQGRMAFFDTQLANTVIKAPITGTILERVVERGEFVTTGFVGDRGAKGYVVSMADLNDLQVELDINQNDFGKLAAKQKGTITTDAYPDKKYAGAIEEISPEANRQKATVQVKVKVLNPDAFLRPEMNASVAFYNEAAKAPVAAARAVVIAPTAAIKDGAVFVAVNGKAVKRAVRTSGSTPQGMRVEDGLNGGEDLILNPSAELKDGAKINVVQ